jgi:Leucine-rich repeat (LRR) protein
MNIKIMVSLLLLSFLLVLSLSCNKKADLSEEEYGDSKLIKQLQNQKAFSLGVHKLSGEIDIDNFAFKSIGSEVYVNDGFRAIMISLKKTKTKNITIKNYSKLKRIEIKYCSLKNIKVSNLPELKSLSFLGIGSFEKELQIDIFNLPKLKKLKLDGICFGGSRLILNLSNLPELVSAIFEDIYYVPYFNLCNFPELKELKINKCGIKTLSLSKLPKLTFLDIQKNERLEKADLSGIDTLEELILPDLEISKLQEVQLNKNNKAWPGVVSAYYERDELDRIVSEEYFDVNRKYCNHPIYGYAKKEYEYRYSPKMFFEKKKTMKFTAKEVNAKNPAD